VDKLKRVQDELAVVNSENEWLKAELAEALSPKLVEGWDTATIVTSSAI
jgi:hypothetical protein